MTHPLRCKAGLALPIAAAISLAAASARAGDDEHAKDPVTLDLSAHLGGSLRVGQAPSLVITDRTGLVAGGGLVFSPLKLFGIGVAYEHINIDTERLGDDTVNSATVDREMHALWFGVRVHPVRRESFAVLFDVGGGLAWQRAHASGVIDPEGTGRTAGLFLCDADDSANFALRASAGVEVPLGGGLLFTGDVSFENARLSGELLDRCISGAGNTTILSLRAGLMYRFDLRGLFRGAP